jgi:hypothetical protein
MQTLWCRVYSMVEFCFCFLSICQLHNMEKLSNLFLSNLRVDKPNCIYSILFHCGKFNVVKMASMGATISSLFNNNKGVKYKRGYAYDNFSKFYLVLFIICIMCILGNNYSLEH